MHLLKIQESAVRYKFSFLALFLIAIAVPAAFCGDNPSSAPGSSASGNDLQILSGLQRRIKRAWFPPKGAGSHLVTIRFTLHQNGTASDEKVVRKSGSSLADQSALKAVQNAAPFLPIPGGRGDLILEVDFNYKTTAEGVTVKIVADGESK